MWLKFGLRKLRSAGFGFFMIALPPQHVKISRFKVTHPILRPITLFKHKVMLDRLLKVKFSHVQIVNISIAKILFPPKFLVDIFTRHQVLPQALLNETIPKFKRKFHKTNIHERKLLNCLIYIFYFEIQRKQKK